MFDDTPVDIRHRETCAAHLFDLAGSAVMVDMGMGDEHILDVLRIQAKRAHAINQRVGCFGIRRIDQDESGACADDKRTDALSPDVVNVIENLEWIDLLLTYRRSAPSFAPWGF